MNTSFDDLLVPSKLMTNKVLVKFKCFKWKLMKIFIEKLIENL